MNTPMIQLSQDELQRMLCVAAKEGAQTALGASDAFVNLDNCTNNQSESSDISKEENNDMSRTRIRHNLVIGHAPDGKPITRWINGYTMQEIIENGAALLRPAGVQEAPETRNAPAFRQYATSWLSLYKTHTVRHTTYSEYASILQKHLIPAFGDLPVTEITTDKIQQLLNDKREYASKTLHEIQMVLGMVLEGAVEDGLIPRNPAKSKRLRNPSTKKKERLALTEEQVADILNHLPTLKQKRDQRYLALLIYTGMRREEVLALRWEDVDLENGLLHVRRAITFKGNLPVIGETKTQKGKRTIPLHPDLLQWLTHEENNVEYVMQDNVTSSTMKRTWERIKSEINVYGATPHCFRHTFTTVCRRSGMDEKTMQVIGGWSDIATMRNVYTHVQQTDLKRAGQLMGGMFQARNLPCELPT
ncbi:MAG: site-specific integrase [Clostridiales bacterium]|nr:site-specific integrase [Clostridiales bacterium]